MEIYREDEEGLGEEPDHKKEKQPASEGPLPKQPMTEEEIRKYCDDRGLPDDDGIL